MLLLKILRKVVIEGLYGVISGLIFFLLFNFLVLTSTRELYSFLINIFKPQYRVVLLKLTELVVKISFWGITIGIIVGIMMSSINTNNKIIRKIIYGVISGFMWGIVSGFIMFHDFFYYVSMDIIYSNSLGIINNNLY